MGRTFAHFADEGTVWRRDSRLAKQGQSSRGSSALFPQRGEGVHYLRDTGQKRAGRSVGCQGGLVAHGAEHLQNEIQVVVEHGVKLDALRGFQRFTSFEHEPIVPRL